MILIILATAMVDINAPMPYIPSIRPYPQLPLKNTSLDNVMVRTLNAPQIAISDNIVVSPRNNTPILSFKNRKPFDSALINPSEVLLTLLFQKGAREISKPEIR